MSLVCFMDKIVVRCPQVVHLEEPRNDLNNRSPFLVQFLQLVRNAAKIDPLGSDTFHG